MPPASGTIISMGTDDSNRAALAALPLTLEHADRQYGFGEPISFGFVSGELETSVRFCHPFPTRVRRDAHFVHRFDRVLETAIEFDGFDDDAAEGDGVSVTFTPDGGRPIRGLCEHVEGGRADLYPTGGPIGLATHGRALRFWLCNLPPFIGDTARRRSGELTRGRIVMARRGLRVTLDPLPDAERIRKRAKNRRSWAVTHAAEIVREDGGDLEFAHADVVAVREAIHWSCGIFTAGFCGPLAVHGIDSSGTPVHWAAPSPQLHRATADRHWLRHSILANHFGDIVNAIADRLEKPLWRELLTRMIWWFVGASRREAGADGALILAQAGVEAAALAILVHELDRVPPGKSGFEGWNAAAKLRGLADVFGAWAPDGRAVPELIATTDADADFFDAVARRRNDFAHISKPVPPRAFNVSDATFEALMVELQLLEFALLFLCGYRDDYAPRLIAGGEWQTYKKVPWA